MSQAVLSMYVGLYVDVPTLDVSRTSLRPLEQGRCGSYGDVGERGCDGPPTCQNRRVTRFSETQRRTRRPFDEQRVDIVSWSGAGGDHKVVLHAFIPTGTRGTRGMGGDRHVHSVLFRCEMHTSIHSSSILFRCSEVKIGALEWHSFTHTLTAHVDKTDVVRWKQRNCYESCQVDWSGRRVASLWENCHSQFVRFDEAESERLELPAVMTLADMNERAMINSTKNPKN